MAKTVERIVPEEALVAAQNQVVDHSRSNAYQLYFNSLGIHLNVEGRDPDGNVTQEEYDEVRRRLIEELEAVRDPDGNLVFNAVYPREEIYSGDQLEEAPDVILEPREYLYDVSGSILDTFRRFHHKNHKPEGILLTNQPIGDPETARIYDVAPTVAASLQLPVDTNSDGRVLLESEEQVEEASWDEFSKEWESDTGELDTSNVEERLANLGYME